MNEIYVILYGGRTSPTDAPDDHGSQGPVLGPFERAECAYLDGFEFGADGRLHAAGDFIFYDGIYYAHAALITGARFDEREDLRRRHVEFDQSKAVPPPLHGLSEDEDQPRRGFYRYEPPDGRRPHEPEHEVVFGIFPADGDGAYRELSMCWRGDHAGGHIARLEVTYESFDALSLFRDVQRELSFLPGLTPDDFCELLTRLGFLDMTAAKCPRAVPNPRATP